MNSKSLPLLRRMTVEDLDSVVAIEKHSFSDPWSYDSFKKELERPYYSCPLVLENRSNFKINFPPILGFVVLWNLETELHIADLAIHHKCRRCGLGEQLVRTAFFLGQQWSMDRFLLEVRQSNIKAKQLYQKLGFEQIAIRKNYYRTPVEDALLLCLTNPPKQSNIQFPFNDDILKIPKRE